MKKADRIRNMLRKELFGYFLYGTIRFLFGSHISHHRNPWHSDVAALLGYDAMKRKSSEFVPLPQLQTEAGRTLLKKMLRAYDEDLPVCDLEYQKKLLTSGGWLCICGRPNPKYTFTCVCGRSKESGSTHQTSFTETSSAPSFWHCICGKDNSFRSPSCTCGRKKQDVPISHRYPISKGNTWRCSCGRENPSYTSTCVCGKNKRNTPQE